MPFVTRVQDLGQRRLACRGAQSAHIVDGAINLRLTKIALWNQTRNRSAVPPNYDGLDALQAVSNSASLVLASEACTSRIDFIFRLVELTGRNIELASRLSKRKFETADF